MSIIMDRRSTRQFTDEAVSTDILADLIEAGLAAPSSKNLRPYKFTVVDDVELIASFTEVAPNWKLLSRVKQFIIVFGDLKKDEREAQMIMATSAATQNILLRCEELGLGAVWIGCYPDESRVNFIREVFELPQHIVPVSIVALGHKVVE